MGPRKRGSPMSAASSDLQLASDVEDDDYVDETLPEEVEDPGYELEAMEDESDFNPEEPEDDGPKRKAKGKAKGKTAKAVKAGSPVRRKSSVSTPKGTWAVPEGAKRSTVLALEASELMAFPPAYRDYLLGASASIARTTTERGPSGSVKLATFPIGPVTPFTTSLVGAEPNSDGSERIQVTEDPQDAQEREQRRRDDARETAKRTTVFVPRDLWQGEPWYKEMFRNQNAHPAPGVEDDLPPGWSWPSDVRLGRTEHGRSPPVVLSTSAGEQHLPRSKPLKVFMGAQSPQKLVEVAQFASVPFKTSSHITSGVVFNSGGPVWGLDWCPYPDAPHTQYLAVSTSSTDSPIGFRGPSDARGAIQLWSVNGESRKASCELVLCLEGGAAHELKWMPLGAWDDDRDSPQLGVIAAVQEDGSVSLYAVPHPAKMAKPSDRPAYVRVTPLLKLSVPDAACTCIDWLSGTRIVSGLSDGHLVVWDVDCLLEGRSEQPLPSLYVSAAISPMRSVASGRCPPTTAAGDYDYSGDAVFVAYSSWDGTVGMVDLRDPSTAIDLNRARLPAMAVAWSSQPATPVYADVDYMVSLAQIRLQGPYNYLLAPHRGPLWDIATSDYHTMIASCASDGAVLVSNCGMGFYRRKMGGLLYQRLYELDWDEHTDEYRMTDSYMPEASSLEDALKHAKKKGGKNSEPQQAPTEGDVATVKTAVWARNVGIHKVTWQCGAGLGQAGWLASGGWSGLVRVDRIRG